MTRDPLRPEARSGVIRAGGAFIDAAACAALWPILRAHLAAHASNGGRVRPEMRAAVDAMRIAALEHAVSADGHAARTSADTGAPSEGAPHGLANVTPLTLTTAQVADRLAVSGRHARRIAASSGVQPLARDAWAVEDVEVMASLRREPT